jgi:hypothetical protein
VPEERARDRAGDRGRREPRDDTPVDAARARVAEAAATATVVARPNEPLRALERNLGRLFAAFQNPVGPAYDDLGKSFSQAALVPLRAEADYLRQTGRHLAGESTFNVDASPPTPLGPDRSSIRTHERWVYDERDDADVRRRCFVEDSDQTYTLVRGSEDWLVEEVQFAGSSRVNC